MMSDNASNYKTLLHEQVSRAHGYHRPDFQDTMEKMSAIRTITADTSHQMIELCQPNKELHEALDLMDLACRAAIASLARDEPQGRRPNTTSHPNESSNYEEIWNSALGFEAKEAVIKSKFMREYNASPEQAQDFWNEMCAVNEHEFVLPS